RGRGADRGEASGAERARVLPRREQLLEEHVDAVPAREDDPREARELAERVVEHLRPFEPGDLDRRRVDRFGAEPLEAERETRGLLAWPRDDDPPAEERAALEPGDALAQTNDVADDEERR